MRTIPFGVIGCGMMGREFASAAARWCHLPDMKVRPEIVAICNRRDGPFAWFRQHFPGIRQTVHEYRALLDNPAVEAVYVAVPHHLHREIYCAVVESGKHLIGEKPFGIDLEANLAIIDCLQRHPKVMARCASQWAFYPAAQRIGRLLEEGAFGRIIEANSGFLHSSDLDPNKPLNWKRQVEFNGSYGCMGDLGMHACAIPFRANWAPQNVRAILSDIIPERPDGKGGRAACSTWDNATLLCATRDPGSGEIFPWTLKTQRIAPGQKNSWYLEVFGLRASARFSTAQPKLLEWLPYEGGEQMWRHVQTGHETAFKTITGPNFEFGAPDALLQMWAAALHELDGGTPPGRYSSCVTPEETTLSHRLFTAALTSQREGSVAPL